MALVKCSPVWVLWFRFLVPVSSLPGCCSFLTLFSLVFAMPIHKLKIVGVMAGSKLPSSEGNQQAMAEKLANELGGLIARLGCHLLTGAGGGMMNLVCKAFANEPNRAGRVIGIVPGKMELRKARANYERKPGYPNAYVEIPIFTHLHESGELGLQLRSRNHINALTPDVIVIMEGGIGTLTEVVLALAYHKPVIAFLSNSSKMRASLTKLCGDQVPLTSQLEEIDEFIQGVTSLPSNINPKLPTLPEGVKRPNF